MSEQQTASTFLHQQLPHTQELASELAAFIKLSISCQFGCSAHKASPCIQVNWALVPCKCTCREQAWHSATAKTWAGPQAQAGQLAGAAQPAGTTTASSASPAALPALPHLVGRPCGDHVGDGFFLTGASIQNPFKKLHMMSLWCKLSPSDFIPLNPILPVQLKISKLY